WPSTPGASISQDVDESSCGPPQLQEALAFAAAVGLNASEASLLTAPLGYNVTAVERRYGEAVFYLQPDLTYVVPLVYEVQWPNSGRLLLVNPSAVNVTWAVEVRLSNKSSSSGSSHGRLLGVFNVSLPPYSARWLYLFGASEVGGLYVLSYRVRAVGSYSWGPLTFNTDGRLVAQNGSLFNWLLGFFESLGGRLSGNQCAVAYGDGRRWAAGEMFLQGLATELDVTAGGVLTVLTFGDYGAVRLGGRSAAEAVAAASDLARAARALRLVQWAALLANGAALGYDAYLKAASGEVPWEEIADAAVLAAGPVVQRARAVSALLAAGSGVMLFLGEPFDAASQFSQELYSAASQYGNYSDCFVSGALAALSTYVKEVYAANAIGVVSTFVDLSRATRSPAWAAYRQLAALSAFEYRTPGPIYIDAELLRRLGGNYKFVFVGKEKIGVNQNGELRLFYIGSEKGVYRVFTRSIREISSVDILSKGGYTAQLVRFYYPADNEYLLGARILLNNNPVVLGYNDALVAALVGKATTGLVWKGEDVHIARKLFNTYIINFDVSKIEHLTSSRETLVKYLMGPVLSELYGIRPELLGFEVSLPSGYAEVTVRMPMLGINPNDKGLQIYIQGPRPDLLGILEDGRLLWVEVKNLDRLSSFPPDPNDINYVRLKDEFLSTGDRAMYLKRFIKDMGAEKASSLLTATVLAFSGAGPTGGTVSNVFTMSPVYKFPDLSGKVRVVFIVGIFPRR
ncbi:MAG: hypothetical protein QXK63_00615, partial [Thermoproteus sp.]